MRATKVGRVILNAPQRLANVLKRRVRDNPPYLAALLALAPFARATDYIPETPRAIQAELKSFATVASVLYVAAHPDDENNALLAQLARGRGYRTAYLSLTRGDGGQNEIGPEFGEKLGLARTHELLAARRADGGRQYFTRALDYGFSKDVNEALRLWEHEKVLGDVVRVYRLYRPDVVFAGMSPVQTPGQHGQHVASAVLAIEAFKLAGDPTKYPEHFADGLKPWQPKRIIGRGGGGRGGRGGGAPAAEPPAAGAVRFEMPTEDPATGESLGNIASRSRSMHKTQFGLNFGAAGGGGAFGTGGGGGTATFNLIAGDPSDGDLFGGLDTTFARFPGGADVAKLADEAAANFKLDDPAASVPALLAIRAKLATLPTDPVVADKRAQLDRILQACLGLDLETTVAAAEAVPGETLKLRHTATVKAKEPLKLVTVRYPSSKGGEKIDAALTPGQPLVREASTTLPARTPISQPYWLREEAAPGLFRVDESKLIGLAENPPAFPVEFVFSVGGQTLVVATEPVQIVAGAPAAQQKRKLTVIPPVSLGFPYETELFHLGATKTTIVEITAARAGSAGTVRLTGPAGWKISPAAQPFTLAKVGDKARVTFTVTAPAQTARGALAASAEIGGATYHTGRSMFSYAHLPVQLLQPPARLKVTACDFAIRGKAVGYLPGAGDNTAENLEQLGYTVRPLTGADLTPEKLAGLDAVVIGVRAFNERRDLEKNLPGLFAWVEAGGTVIAQYNRPSNNLRGPLAPYELSINGNAPALRVTDETAPVTFVASGHPALNLPNKIGPADFDGWVQERGAYFPSAWDKERFQTILAMSDPGEKQPDSSLLVAQHGKGYYVYTGIAFFRQLPAGVPGAYRLFANLVSLGK
ncbi:MAG: PIG-L family deacetylase [Verrucomicrobia bacterium]|nr:PIG-L family deacetylase [Verrucomicrobiota bacterium]